MPYSVSLTECECRSIATNTWVQKIVASTTSVNPGTDEGRYVQPHGVNHARMTPPC
jgi:hypothetical protein